MNLESPSKCGRPGQTPHLVKRGLLPKCSHTVFNPTSVCRIQLESFLTHQEQMVKCSQQSAKDLFDLCHKQDVHMTRSSPSNKDTSRWFTLKCSHFQVLHTPATSRRPPPSVSHCSHKELCSPSTHGGVDGGSAERQLRSCLWTRRRGGARGRHTRRSWQRFLTRRQRSIFGVREANLEPEKTIWSQKSIFGV